MKNSTDIFVGLQSANEVSKALRDYYEEGVWDIIQDVQPFDNGVIVRTQDLDRYDHDDLHAVLVEEYGMSAVNEL